MGVIKFIVKKTWKEIITKREAQWIIVFLNGLLFIATLVNFSNVDQHNKEVNRLSEQVREKWENNPDKHPHRMAHYGYIVFRTKHPLSFFDKGLDKYLGNSVFLEAHKQNTTNFSDNSFSNNIIAFGELSAGMIIQLLLTLLIFFWGYGLISKERENGMLKLILVQGVSWRSIIFGKTIGLFLISLTIIIPVFILGLTLLYFGADTNAYDSQIYTRYGLLFTSYMVYFFTISLFTVLISALIRSSQLSLTVLIGYWLFFVVIFPKISVVLSQTAYPSPSKVEFDIEAENEMLKYGDSHNPDDSYFKNLSDSLLKKYNVASTKELPFNYGGFVMKESEKLSAHIYSERKQNLTKTFIKQQNFVKWASIVNPYIAIKNISTSFAGTDFQEYVNFEEKAEEYRYFLAQFLNDLHINHVPNNITSSADKRAALNQSYWKKMNNFEYSFRNVNSIILKEMLSIGSLIFWLLAMHIIVSTREKYFKVV